MSGAGNDFIVIDNRFYAFTGDELSKLATELCPRRTAIGADGILGFDFATDPQNAFRMQYYNADGSRGSMCGNGARCLVAYAFDNLEGAESDISFETDAGVLRGARSKDEIRLYVEAPENYHQAIFEDGAGVCFDYIWTGTEHAVAKVKSVANIDVSELGARVRHAEELKPNGANVDFVEVVSRGSSEAPADLRVRTYEKGVEGETLACGTGAIASAIFADTNGLIEAAKVRVQMPGGILTVGFVKHGDQYAEVYLQGPAQTIYRGTFGV